MSEERYTCLYCDAELVGDADWIKHLNTLKHGAVRRAYEIEAEQAAWTEIYSDAEPQEATEAQSGS